MSFMMLLLLFSMNGVMSLTNVTPLISILFSRPSVRCSFASHPAMSRSIIMSAELIAPSIFSSLSLYFSLLFIVVCSVPGVLTVTSRPLAVIHTYSNVSIMSAGRVLL